MIFSPNPFSTPPPAFSVILEFYFLSLNFCLVFHCLLLAGCFKRPEECGNAPR